MNALSIPFDAHPMTVIERAGEVLVPVSVIETALGYAPKALTKRVREWEKAGHLRPQHLRLILRSEISGDLLTRQTSVPDSGTDLDLTGRSDLLCATERGVYRLLMLSRQPKAEAFQDWLETEVLPALARGQLEASKPTLHTLAERALGAYALKVAGQGYYLERIALVARVINAMVAGCTSIEAIRFFAKMRKTGAAWAVHELQRHGLADDAGGTRAGDVAVWELTLDDKPVGQRQIEASQ